MTMIQKAFQFKSEDTFSYFHSLIYLRRKSVYNIKKINNIIAHIYGECRLVYSESYELYWHEGSQHMHAFKKTITSSVSKNQHYHIVCFISAINFIQVIPVTLHAVFFLNLLLALSLQS